ncbi:MULTISPECIES: hypothetical protein [Pseudoalteromonas]|uniref:Uncharacterized protein n=1 Tax=Pseudoalteromonas aurantia 208 TaxID=1314867 RepID=A0ABR9EHB7_9GAMM|nr:MULTISPECIES: hypothetical protein [Pseudoalteromonas]MBE0370395.1 hypothetical protein [Pseudoalteromonas aurantia 208]MBQ4845342.1 hypothetical protein [Pseudoalteromonas sp. MMG005]
MKKSIVFFGSLLCSISSSLYAAPDPIFIGGTKYVLTDTDFSRESDVAHECIFPTSPCGLFYEYNITIPVVADAEYDPQFDAQRRLTFDVFAHSGTGRFDFTVRCGDYGTNNYLNMNQWRTTSAQLTRTLNTFGRCKELKVSAQSYGDEAHGVKPSFDMFIYISEALD